MNSLKLALATLAALAAAGVTSAATPYIAKVYEFCPAPGQFVHEVPMLSDDMSPDEVIAEVEAQLCGNDVDGATPGMVSLGAFGGYVVFAFDHPVVNLPDAYDFKIYGNSFQSATEDVEGGSSEPGIVMVSVDVNGNGLPDDPWYELAGSEYSDPSTFHGFEITYTRPADNTSDYAWTSNDPDNPSGAVERNRFHTQSYWPGWYAGESLTFRGTRLAGNAEDLSGNGTNWFQHFLPWGYVDNRPNDSDPGLKIDWAVDAEGAPVHLPQIDFIKVYTAMTQNCGWLGETSTSVCGGEDLHPDAVVDASIATVGFSDDASAAEYFDLRGVRVIPASPGLYICRKGTRTSKVIIL